LSRCLFTTWVCQLLECTKDEELLNNKSGQVLFKLKPDVTAEQVESWRKIVLAMKGQIPGEYTLLER
jgi:hypothetical protein